MTCLPLEKIAPRHGALVGGKAAALACLARRGYAVPPSLCVTVEAYRRYLEETGLGEKILMELGRKDFAQMRWEEIWDAALRIRSLFLTTPIPAPLEAELTRSLQSAMGERPAAVRSSSPGEDSAQTSFAGLHESFVNVRGSRELLLAMRKVWASLWSDRALLYRQELNLSPESSAMAVLVQELVEGEKSGVAFSRSPLDPHRMAVEAVWGLNQGLVDGSVEPDLWELDRQGQAVLDFRSAVRTLQMLPAAAGVKAAPLDPDRAAAAPLDDGEVLRVAKLALSLEALFGCPQDVEWTFRGNELVVLQSRPITAGAGEGQADQRRMFLGLRRSLESLKDLRRRIEEEIIPGMEGDARAMAAIAPEDLDDDALAAEIGRRRGILARWEESYRVNCIPMAQGIRLFGEFYNDALQPDNPFEFVELLHRGDLRAIGRNSRLAELAAGVRDEAALLEALEGQGGDLPAALEAELQELAQEIGWTARRLGPLVARLARAGAPVPTASAREALQRRFLARFDGEGLRQAEEILELGRASYRLRDDDNISLGKIKSQLERCEGEARRRLDRGGAQALKPLFAARTHRPGPPAASGREGPLGTVRARQLQGQPASAGLATARARVIACDEDLAAFRAGEILVCDAIDPAMTFVVPLAAGIVERRGGMLIHGAIIAREYGIPCVTGVPEAASLIRSGDRITLDGYLGLVFLDSAQGRSPLSPRPAP